MLYIKKIKNGVVIEEKEIDDAQDKVEEEQKPTPKTKKTTRKVKKQES